MIKTIFIFYLIIINDIRIKAQVQQCGGNANGGEGGTGGNGDKAGLGGSGGDAGTGGDCIINENGNGNNANTASHKAILIAKVYPIHIYVNRPIKRRSHLKRIRRI